METISQLCKCSKWVHSLSGVISGLIEGRQISGRLLKGANIFFWCEEKEKEKDELRRINTSSIQRWELNCTCASWRGSRGPWILPHCASWVLHVLLREHLSIRQAIQYVVYMLYWGWPPPPPPTGPLSVVCRKRLMPVGKSDGRRRRIDPERFTHSCYCILQINE